MNTNQGNILNRKPKQIRDKNFSIGQSEVTAHNDYVAIK